MRARGFTLIELVVTVAIIGLLASMALPIGQLAMKRSKEAELIHALREIRRGIDEYKEAADDGRIELEVGKSGYPPDLRTLVDGVDDAKSEKKARIYFMRRLPRDPFYPDSSAKPEDSWGLRSYESPADAPEAGDDVFDVHSLSAATGINGVPYRDW